ncbi:MAG: adenosylcobalamin-dependent ribonucleoside-diphosphate reductase [Planctomycetota bacterium]
MKITRKFTTQGQDVFATAEWTKRASKISNPDGSVVFEMGDAEVPSSWSQLATDIMVSKYFRKAGVPQTLPGHDVVAAIRSQGWLRDDDGRVVTGPERSAKQVIHRLAGCWRQWGERHGYFDSAEDAQAFYDELCYMMIHQMAAPNSPQWFNTGLHFAYGITGPAQGHYVADPKTGEVSLADDAYSHPQPHACFIQSVDDSLVEDGGIMDLWVREARLFKYGSGTGTNFSNLRAENEPLSGGGKSSGLMSWLKIGDRAAGAIKSGGTTRRAAKMVCLDMDHPDIDAFVNWKVREEVKVAALVEGLKTLKEHDESIKETADRLGLTLDYDFNGESYQTVSGQNSNNSVRIPDSFFDAVDDGGKWQTFNRTDGSEGKTLDANVLWDDISYAAWRCADPGVQYDSTINAWHTCPSAGRINASNPCSEYMFLDNTACNLASLNVLKFFDAESGSFDVERYEHATDLWTVVLEISVLMAAFPSKEIAELSYRYRTLGLGYANLGAMLMQAGIPYDSDEGRSICAMLTSILTGRSYRQSALLAKEHGPFAGYADDKDSMLRVIRNHRRAAHGVDRDASEWEALRTRPVPIDHELVTGGRLRLADGATLLKRATEAWDEALAFGEDYGYRNAQVTVIAPTGTIGLLMDCDTTGVEPDFALVKFKKLAGGGYFKIANDSLEPALRTLGYSDEQITLITTSILGTLNLAVPMPEDADGIEDGETLAEWLMRKGLTPDTLKAIEAALPGVFELSFAFSAWSIGDEALKAAGIDPDAAKADPSFNLLRAFGLTAKQIGELNRLVCGSQTIEGAPGFDEAHLPVFDCANKCGPTGTRFIRPEGHILMMAAAQPFISGAISKTINLPNEASVDDIKECYRLSWELGIKANALYRDGCKLSQPLSNKSDVDIEEDEDVDAMDEAREEVAGAVAEMAGAIAGGEGGKAEAERVKVIHRPMRRRLPDTRQSMTHKFNVAGHEGYLTVGLYEDGMPGELFITMAKEGSTIGGLMDSLGTAVSVALQYGVPVPSLVNKFTHQRFEPAGMTANSDIPFAKSLVDYIFRWLGMQFIPGYREANLPNRGAVTATTGSNPDRTAEKTAERTDASPRHAGTAAKTGGRLTTKTDGDARWKTSHTEADRGPIARIGIDSNPSPSQDGTPTLGLVNEGGAERIVPAKTEPIIADSSAVDARPTDSASGAATMTEPVLDAQESALSAAMSANMGDAPPCDVCGTITVRNGHCYKCMNCGNSLGCS